MTVKLIKNKDGKSRSIADSYEVLNLLTAEDSEQMSVAVGRATVHKEVTQNKSDCVYYLSEGEMIVNGELKAKSGDVVYISGNTEYKFEGTFRAVIVNSLPFKKKNEDILKIINED